MPTNVLTAEELEMIRDYVLIPFMLDYVDNRIHELNQSTISLKAFYLKVTEVLRLQIDNDRKRIKSELKQRNIKLVQEDRIDFAIYYKIYFKGTEDKFGMMKELVKSEMGIKLRDYMNDLMKQMTR